MSTPGGITAELLKESFGGSYLEEFISGGNLRRISGKTPEENSSSKKTSRKKIR